jgi:hypothetical protein
LQRGAVVAVSTGDGTHDGGGGASTLAFALLAAASATGSWCAAVGTGHPGILAIAELGVDLDHLALVPHPGPAWPEVVASLLDGMDAVLVCPPGRGRAGAARRLVARARQRRAVLVVLAGRQGWPVGPDVRLTVGGGTWGGVGTGHGHLRGRRVEVVATGRRAAAGTVRAGLWLPTESGTVTPV